MKRIMVMTLVLMLSLAMCIGTAYAAAYGDAITPLGGLAYSAGLEVVNASTDTYRVYASVRAYATENLRVYVELYDSNDRLIGSASGRNEGAYASASFEKRLSSDTYKIVATFYGDTESKSLTKYYTI